MHDALSREPGDRHGREQRELAQFAERGGNDQKGEPAERDGDRHPLQHAARHHSPAHRHVVEREGERAESGVKDAEQKTLPPEPPVMAASGHF